MKVFYNESCSICRAEINLYKKQNIKEIEWIDITNNKVAEKDTLKNDKALLRRLHVKEGGQIFSGAQAFLLVWKKIPKYRFLYTFFKLQLHLSGRLCLSVPCQCFKAQASHLVPINNTA